MLLDECRNLCEMEDERWMIRILTCDRDPGGRDVTDELTVIFAVSPHPKAPGFDCRETEPDGFAQRGGVYVRYAILVTNAAIRKVESLARDVSVGVWRIISS